MSKIKKEERPSRKVTDFFQRTSSLASLPPSSSPSAPTMNMSSSHTPKSTIGDSKSATGQRKPVHKVAEIKQETSSSVDVSSLSSLSSGSPTLLTPESSALKSLSSNPSPVIVVSDSPMSKKKTTLQSITTESTSASAKKGFRPRPITNSVAKTSVRRRNLNPPPTTRSSQRTPPVLQLAKSKLSLKRKREHELGEDDLEVLSVLPGPAKSTTSLSRLSTLTSSSAAPLAPKENIPNIPSPVDKLRDSAHSTPVKKRRVNPQSPARRYTISGHDAEELIPSSQSDECELAVTKPLDRNPVEVMESVDKWRRDASVHASQEPSTKLELLPEEESIPPEPDLTVDGMDIDGGLDYVDPPESFVPTSQVDDDLGPQVFASEDEVKHQLDTSQDFSSSSMTPGKPSGAQDTFIEDVSLPMKSLDSIKEDVSMENVFRPHTPPSLDIPLEGSVSKTPIALDQKSKTAQIIAQIRAKAMERALASDDEDNPLEFQELEDSSDEEFDDNIFKKYEKGKGKATAASSPPALSSGDNSPLLEPSSGASPTPNDASKRYNLRRHSPHVNAEAGPSTSKYSLLPLKSRTRKPAAKKKTANPLDALLKEKKIADKRGSGSDALRRAEEAVNLPKTKSKRSLLDEMEDEEEKPDSDSEVDWANEEAAMNIVRQGSRRLILKSSSPARAPAHHGDSDSDDEGEVGEALEEDECRKILGEKDGTAVGSILAKDRASAHEKTKKRKAVRGVVLWDMVPVDDNMGVDDLPSLPEATSGEEKVPLLTALRSAVDARNIRRLCLLLRPDSMELIKSEHCAPLLRWVCHLAFSISIPMLGAQACAVLCQCPDLFISSELNTIHFDIISAALAHLGARRDTLEALGWSVPDGVETSRPGTEDRERSLFRMAQFMSVMHAFQRDAIPDVVLALILIGLDPSTSAALARDIRSTIEDLCSSVNDAACEEQIALKVLSYATQLEPINKSLVVSMFVRGSLQSTRIARWIARKMLLGPNDPAVGPYIHLPSLKPYIELLSPTVGSQGLFDIPGNSDKPEYYEELLCHVEILGVALTDIDGYVEEERAANRDAPRSSILDSPSKIRERSDLETVTRQLDLLHGRIVDTRAAHLDRSRVKAALQQLSFRVHYQRQACLQRGSRSGSGKPRPKNLHSYFSTPK
ncbi:unnamed protein product [Somion occarium]|uniref:Uncharacterized protein n=1 Tax=Somion occarium TaxID=3059160 RepID=A0ABP1DI79_9APHY